MSSLILPSASKGGGGDEPKIWLSYDTVDNLGDETTFTKSVKAGDFLVADRSCTCGDIA